jgi:hypothetical protein
MESEWIHKIFSKNKAAFDGVALEIFRFQYANNHVYHQYVDALGIRTNNVTSITKIPFLPIRFFKSHNITTTQAEPEAVFESSGTTGMVNSKHVVASLKLYRESFMQGFREFYGDPSQYRIIGLLPSYLERQNSSLVVMVDELIRESAHVDSGFYLNELDKLSSVLKHEPGDGRQTLLIGVTFALLDLATDFPQPLHNTIIMETGGMKGRRKEMIRQEVHDILQGAFQVPAIHSEYGMTELLSQGYSSGNGVFKPATSMKILIRDDEDPLEVSATPETTAFITGAINIIDLANLYSCSFIATDDAGRLYSDGSFEVIGRMDNSDLRGCSLMTL